MQGLVTKFFKKGGNRKKCYGFIEGFDGETYYFNGKSLFTDVYEGAEVKFKGSTNEKSNYAMGVCVIDSNNRNTEQ